MENPECITVSNMWIRFEQISCTQTCHADFSLHSMSIYVRLQIYFGFSPFPILDRTAADFYFATIPYHVHKESKQLEFDFCGILPGIFNWDFLLQPEVRCFSSLWAYFWVSDNFFTNAACCRCGDFFFFGL